ncbi:hypothetical protein RFI_21548 [Reticulomyxa filosa]|uniref:Uncharacterized protein n=1 Tax=Reticulomyxa filosa TaxID=46433 RepID=X6MP85_RETFI|nr:hypothetical protein RFI_21548 [Reticulomyxa filosa]|eukprot:ETO15813.1 hypothetical protein RFI_21548 [Reticulomyxa filosa]
MFMENRSVLEEMMAQGGLEMQMFMHGQAQLAGMQSPNIIVQNNGLRMLITEMRTQNDNKTLLKLCVITPTLYVILSVLLIVLMDLGLLTVLLVFLLGGCVPYVMHGVIEMNYPKTIMFDRGANEVVLEHKQAGLFGFQYQILTTKICKLNELKCISTSNPMDLCCFPTGLQIYYIHFVVKEMQEPHQNRYLVMNKSFVDQCNKILHHMQQLNA